MRRYWREEETGDLYDRERDEWLTVVEERHTPDGYEVRDGETGRRHEIDRDEVEEVR